MKRCAASNDHIRVIETKNNTVVLNVECSKDCLEKYGKVIYEMFDMPQSRYHTKSGLFINHYPDNPDSPEVGKIPYNDCLEFEPKSEIINPFPNVVNLDDDKVRLRVSISDVFGPEHLIVVATLLLFLWGKRVQGHFVVKEPEFVDFYMDNNRKYMGNNRKKLLYKPQFWDTYENIKGIVECTRRENGETWLAITDAGINKAINIYDFLQRYLDYDMEEYLKEEKKNKDCLAYLSCN